MLGTASPALCGGLALGFAQRAWRALAIIHFFSLIIKASKARLESAAKDGAAWAARSTAVRQVPPEAASGQLTEAESARFDTNDEWISTRTGIRSRHVAVEETATDLAEAAAAKRRVLPTAAGARTARPSTPLPSTSSSTPPSRPTVLVPSAARAAAPPPGSRERHRVRPERRLHGLRARPDRGPAHHGRFDRRSARCRGPATPFAARSWWEPSA